MGKRVQICEDNGTLGAVFAAQSTPQASRPLVVEILCILLAILIYLAEWVNDSASESQCLRNGLLALPDEDVCWGPNGFARY